MKFDLADTKNNRKALSALFRLFTRENGKKVFTFREISEIFSLKNRQDSNNFYREFIACGEDLLHFLERKIKLKDAFPIIEKLVLEMPLLSIRDQYETFSEEHPEYKMSFTTFQRYFSRIDSKKLKKRYDELLSEKECRIDKERILKEIISEDNLSRKTRKKILTILPELEQDEKEIKNEISFDKDWEPYAKYLLTMFLIGSGMAYESVSMLFGVCKTTIGNWFYKLSFLKKKIIESISLYSGIISVDEKWLKINGAWHFVLSIVDNETGFLLYFMVTSSIDADSWELLFQRFYKHYGVPKQIISDGSRSLAAGRIRVFPTVPHQLCKFHKLKNLMKIISLNYVNPKKHEKMVQLAKNIFKNKTYFGRKRAAKRLMKIAPPKVSAYVRKNIIGNWKHLTKSLTSNASERCNRKIEKVTSKRYGLKSEVFVEQLITSMWLKESMRNNIHFDKSFINGFDPLKKCQDNIKMSNFTKYIARNLLIKVG